MSGNEAIAGQGAKSSTGYSGAVWGFAVGGGIDDSFSGNATVTNCTLIGNEAIGSDGVNGGTGFGGGIALGFSYFFGIPGSPVVDTSTLQLTNSTLVGNLSRGGNGTSGSGGDGLGGGMAINPGSSAPRSRTAQSILTWLWAVSESLPGRASGAAFTTTAARLGLPIP